MLSKRSQVLFVLLAALGVLLLISGAVSGGPETIYQKAARICLECIGVG